MISLNLPISSCRKHFGLPIDESLKIPYLIKVQVDSYRSFLQYDVPPNERQNIGMQQVFLNNFPIVSTNGDVAINFISYRIDPPIYSPMECKNFSATYAGAICLNLEVNFMVENEMQTRNQEVYIGEIAFMTENATFIINGSERIVVSQLHRSPGLFFETVEEEGNRIYTARLIPVKGVWLDFEVDDKHQIFVTINKRRIHATTLLMCLLEDRENVNPKTEVLSLYYKPISARKTGDLWRLESSTLGNLCGIRLDIQLVNIDKRVVVAVGQVLTDAVMNDHKNLYISNEALLKMDLYEDVILGSTILAEASDHISLKASEALPEDFEIKFIHSMHSISKPIVN